MSLMVCRTCASVLVTAVVAWIVVTVAVLRHRLSLPDPLPGPPVTVPFDSRLQTGSEDIPLEALAKTVGLYEPEQIHLAIAGNVLL